MSCFKWRAMSGTGGYNLRVSMRHLSRYFISSVSWKVAGRSESPKIWSSSWITFSWISLWIPIMDRKKLLPAAVVSWPSNMIVSTCSLISSSEITTPLWELSRSKSRKARRFFCPTSLSSTSRSSLSPADWPNERPSTDVTLLGIVSEDLVSAMLVGVLPLFSSSFFLLMTFKHINC